MKISFMLKREDFYEINRKTLETYYQNSQKKKRLYIYPELNAIVTARPSKAVRRYLYTEFRVSGSCVKRLLVWLYATLLLNSGGLLASKSIHIRTDADAYTLIYPCNKKYRVFDFRKNQVSVFGKDGFPKDDLSREMAFRTQNAAAFIPKLLFSNQDGYTEAVIDGCPVARAGARTKELCDRAFAIWSEYIRPQTEEISGEDYAKELEAGLDLMKNRAEKRRKKIDISSLDALCGELLKVVQAADEKITVGLSHGDLQPGNIWVESGTDKLYIIDWESWQRRSTWYDKAALYEGLRRQDGIAGYAQKRDLIHATVLLEDILFRLNELTTLPYDYGCAEFDAYIKVLRGENTNV